MVISIVLLLFTASLAQNNGEKFRIIYDDKSDRTTVILNGIELPKNKDSFEVGASFEFEGKTLKKMPCCAVLFFTSMSRKGFKYKDNHNLQLWADNELFDFGKVNWQESYYGYVLILSGMAYPEEIFIGMETDKFSKIINSEKVKAQLGTFKFNFTASQLKGLKELESFMRANIGKEVSTQTKTD